MPDDRFLHPRLGHSEKVCRLSEVAFRVWIQYILSADDCGVMRYSAVTIQADNDRLSTFSARKIEACLQKFVTCGLLTDFQHQGRRYLCQLDWQEWQKIKHPRPSVQPDPPDDILAQCTPATQALFRLRLQNLLESRENRLKKFSEKGRDDSALARTATATAMATAPAAADARPREHPPTRPGSGVFGGALHREHLTHAACDPTFARCVPQAVHDKLATALSPKYGGDRQAAKDALQVWYPVIWQALAADFVMGDAFRFWQAKFDGDLASKPPSSAKPERAFTVPDADETRRRLRENR
jgi:hypothetical protein